MNNELDLTKIAKLIADTLRTPEVPPDYTQRVIDGLRFDAAEAMAKYLLATEQIDLTDDNGEPITFATLVRQNYNAMLNIEREKHKAEIEKLAKEAREMEEEIKKREVKTAKPQPNKDDELIRKLAEIFDVDPEDISIHRAKGKE